MSEVKEVKKSSRGNGMVDVEVRLDLVTIAKLKKVFSREGLLFPRDLDIFVEKWANRPYDGSGKSVKRWTGEKCVKRSM